MYTLTLPNAPTFEFYSLAVLYAIEHDLDAIASQVKQTKRYKSTATHWHDCICGGSMGSTEDPDDCMEDHNVLVHFCGSCIGYDPTETLIEDTEE